MSERAEKIIDDLLKKKNLIRKQVPKDGACMFRCISEHMYGSQVLHPVLRSQCVRYMQVNMDEFSPFIAGDSDLPWDHYIFELKKPETWGGYLELLALSKMLKVNFIIHTENSTPTTVDQGFPRTINLAFSGGNHYDLVMPEKSSNATEFCQGLIYNLVHYVVQAHAEKPNYDMPPTPYKNIAYDCWIDELQKQESRDQLITQKILEAPQSYTALSGYYKKEPEKEQVVNKDQKKKPRKRGGKNTNTNTTNNFSNNNNNNNNNNKISSPSQKSSPSLASPPLLSSEPAVPLSQEEIELQAILAQIEEVEKKQLNTIAFNQEFPALKVNKVPPKVEPQSVAPPSPSITPSTTTANTSGDNTTSTTDNNVNNTQDAAPPAPKPNAWKSPKTWGPAETKTTQ